MKETLNLTLKKKWFDMIASGQKKEEYREIKPYWISRLMWASFVGKISVGDFVDWCSSYDRFYECSKLSHFQRTFKNVIAKNGYSKVASTVTWQHKGIRVGQPNPAWCEPEDVGKTLFILDIGEIIHQQ